MAQLTNNNANRYRYIDNDERIIHEKTANSKCLLIRSLVRKQLSSAQSIENVLNNKKDFTHATKEVDNYGSDGCLPVSSEGNLLGVSGLGYDDLKFVLGDDAECHWCPDHFEKLKNIDRKLELHQKKIGKYCDKNLHYQQNLYQSAGKDKLHNVDLADITGKIKSHGKSVSEGGSNILGHELNLSKFSNNDDASNCLKALEERLFPKSKAYEFDIGCSKTKKQKISRENSLHPKKNVKSLKLPIETLDTYWDMKSVPSVPLNKISCKFYDQSLQSTSSTEVDPNKALLAPASKIRSHTKVVHATTFVNLKKEKILITNNLQYTHPKIDHSKPFVFEAKSIELFTKEYVEGNKKSLEDIKSLKIFANHTFGPKSNSLFIKNLPLKVDHLILVKLFGLFEEENGDLIEYRILNGRMRGQAFVKFKSSEVCEKALLNCNGFIIDDKPMVLAFAKGKDGNKDNTL